MEDSCGASVIGCLGLRGPDTTLTTSITLTFVAWGLRLAELSSLLISLWIRLRFLSWDVKAPKKFCDANGFNACLARLGAELLVSDGGKALGAAGSTVVVTT